MRVEKMSLLICLRIPIKRYAQSFARVLTNRFEIAPFRYEKAENEIKKKQLNPQVEQAMLQQHSQCKLEAESKFSKIDEVIAQIQLYQACMDYHISQVRGFPIVGSSAKSA